MKRQIIAVAALAGLLLAACGDDDESTTETTAATETTATEGGYDLSQVSVNEEAKACAGESTLEAGVLTIATGDPAFPPYVIDDDPASGQGFEAAIALAVAKQMGFEGEGVTWIRTAFDTAIAPGEKEFDFNLQQYSINAEREQVVDFSDPYYAAPQAVVGKTDGSVTVASLSDLRTLNIGVASATTSLTFVEDVVQPDNEAFVYNSNADAKAALDTGQIDVIVADLPTALYLANVELDNATVFGQFPPEVSEAEEWGMLFAKGNPLVECVNLALDDLTSSGLLTAITDTWMGEYTEAAVLPAD